MSRKRTKLSTKLKTKLVLEVLKDDKTLNEIAIKEHIKKIFTQVPIYGKKKVHQQCLEDGLQVSLNTVSKYRKQFGLKAILAVKSVSTMVATTGTLRLFCHGAYPMQWIRTWL